MLRETLAASMLVHDLDSPDRAVCAVRHRAERLECFFAQLNFGREQLAEMLIDLTKRAGIRAE